MRAGLGRAGRQLQFRSERCNLMNHAPFATPGSTQTSPAFGQPTDAVNSGRVTQLSLRLVYSRPARAACARAARASALPGPLRRLG